jgi:hypothetical protein
VAFATVPVTLAPVNDVSRDPLPTMKLPVTFPVALIRPAVNKLPPIILPLAETNPVTYSPVGANTAMLPTPLTDIVTLAAAAEILTLLLPFTTFETEVILPLTETTAPSKLDPVTVPVALTTPPVIKLPALMFPEADMPPPEPLNVSALPYTLPVADINPDVNKLPPVILAALVIVLVADINPAVKIFPCIALPVLDINPAVNKLPPIIFAAEVIVLVAEINPAVRIFPPVILPLPVIVPSILTPVGENTATLPIVLTETVTLALADAIITLLFPLLMLLDEVLTPVNKAPLPKI